MTRLLTPQLIRGNDYSGLYEFSTENGTMITSYHSRVRWYTICSIDTYAPRQGIGKLLLESAKADAIQRGADIIMAGIVSRECLESMRSVFGEAALDVQKLGAYAINGDPAPAVEATLASLYCDLSIYQD